MSDRCLRIAAALALAAAALLAAAPAWTQEDDPELRQLLGAPQGAPAASTPRSSTTTGLSNAFNPAISVNGLILGAGSKGNSTSFGLQEFEIQFSSDIDPYFRADLTFAIHQDFDVAGLAAHEHGGEEEEEIGGGIEVEQALITSTSLPHVTLHFGKFLLPFGKHNILHTHAFPFITKPAVISENFGEEGLNEMAFDAVPLLPLPFFSELNLVAFQGDNEVQYQFGEGAAPNKAKYLVHSKNLVEITDDSTVELGLSYADGTNNAGDGKVTTITGADLTFKRRPAIGRGLGSLVVQAEYIASTRQAEQDLESSGYYASAQWRVFGYYWAQARYGEVTIDEGGDGAIEEEETKHTDFLIGWVPTEFSALRLQYSLFEIGGEKVNAWYLQYNFAIGSHPAHSY